MGHQLTDAILLERRTDVKRVGLLREHEGEEALAVAPANAREIVERGPTGNHDGVDPAGVHEGSGALETRFALGGGDGLRFPAAVAERGDGGRQRGFGGGNGLPGPGQCGRGGGGKEEAAASQHRIVIARGARRPRGDSSGRMSTALR